ncbi:hypothetical protein [Egicoccus sp. AB-alg6-2]|uniref:hypothetical protein n=1 Tax=Egicoccus sp. AB-alg6-2 TaxID=3242692 RepID=UPI00359D0916
MRDELPDWMDPPAEDAAAPRRRLHRLLVLAAVPWVVVAALVAWRSAPAEPTRTTSGPAGTHETAGPSVSDPSSSPPADDDADDVAAPPADTVPSAGDTTAARAADDEVFVDPDLHVEQLRGGWREMPGDGATVVVALAVARAWLTGLGPQLHVDVLGPRQPDHYAEHLVVEAIERPAAGAAVVTLLAVMLDASDEGQAHLRRVAVPVDESGLQPQPAGQPWPLPVPAFTVTSPAVTDELDEAFRPAAEEALTAAGFTDFELRGLQRTAGWPVLASVRTSGPDGDEDHVVWLRRHVNEFVVAGLPLTEALPSMQGQEVVR